MRPKIVIGIKNEQDKSGDPDFYEVSGLDWVKQLENQYPIIRAELDSLLSTAAIQPNF